MKLQGRLFCLFSYDVAHEIHLDRVRARIEPTASGSLAGGRARPIHLAYSTPPLHVGLGEHELDLVDGPARATTTAWLHEFGGATVVFESPLRCDAADLPALTAHLNAQASLERVARGLLADLTHRLADAVEHPGETGPVEDYFVVQIDTLEPAASVEEMLATHGPTLAAALRCETETLSAAETADALQGARSYYARDLVLADWNVAIVLDADYHDAVAVLEFLNVQLVELRYYDDVLDRRIASLERAEHLRARRFPLANRRLHRAIDELATIRVDMATIFERVHNTLKLGGDLYLAQIYATTARRLGLEVWERSVARKLEVVQEIYDVLVERAATARAEVLELTIISLILVEIVLSLAGGCGGMAAR